MEDLTKIQVDILMNSSSTSMSIKSEPKLNGVNCPNCAEELYDTFPNITLTSDPAQKNVHCGNCNYVGYRFV